MAYYVIGEGNNFYEGMTKEQILAAITQAIETHTITDVDTGFVTTIKEKNKNTPLALWVGTEAEFNAIEEKDQNTLYIKTDDSTLEAIEEVITEYNERLEFLEAAADKAVFKSGDTGELTWKGAGYITNSAKNIHFSVPLPKALPSGLRADLTKFDPLPSPFISFSLTVIQNGNYIVGEANQPATWSSEYITTSNSGNLIDFNVWKGDMSAFDNATNNDTVGIKITFNFYIHGVA